MESDNSQGTHGEIQLGVQALKYIQSWDADYCERLVSSLSKRPLRVRWGVDFGPQNKHHEKK
jgi:hypothetical protein